MKYVFILLISCWSIKAQDCQGFLYYRFKFSIFYQGIESMSEKEISL